MRLRNTVLRYVRVLCRLFTVLTALWMGCAMAGPAEFTERQATPELLRQLRAGGYVLYLRHGLTESNRSDPWPLGDPKDCSAQRALSAAGRAQMVRIGLALRERRIPLGEILTSPLCRTRESAAAVALHQRVLVEPRLAYVGNMTSAEKEPNIRRTRELLMQAVPAGSNRLIVGHGPNLMDLIGYFPAEGTLVIFQPAPDGPRYLGSVAADAWATVPP